MDMDVLIERFFETLIDGDRTMSRRLVSELLHNGLTPEMLLTDLFWPTYEMVDRLYRGDQLSNVSHNLATRLLRVLVDQNAARFDFVTSPERTIFAISGPSESEELSAQMAVDMLESRGFAVSFAGSGIPADEVLQQVHERQPDVLLMFASSPGDLPELRSLIDSIREIGACDNTQIVVGGGVFNRAEGLAEELGADLWADCPLELVEEIAEHHEHRAPDDQRTVGRRRRSAA